MYAYRRVASFHAFREAEQRAEALYARRRAADEAWVVELWSLPSGGGYALVFFVKGQMPADRFRQTARAVLGDAPRFARSMRSIVEDPGRGSALRRVIFQSALSSAVAHK